MSSAPPPTGREAWDGPGEPGPSAPGAARWDAFPDVVETHISVIVFIGDRAYKFLKPVRTAFLDHSTRARRRWSCHEEVSVNRRFAPDVYLGVADITTEDGRLLDHVIVMRRMPADRRLSRLLDDPGTPAVLSAIAERLAEAHRQAPPVRRNGAGDRRQLRALWDAGLEQTARFAGEILNPEALALVDREAHRYLAGRGPLFDLRVAEGHVRDGHGDLLADDIFCLPDGPRILDGLAFDAELRVADTLSDAAFLAMDLASLSHARLGDEFLARHTRALGDHFPPSLGYHYLGYRAFVRAKIACLAAEQGRSDKVARAQELLALTEGYLRRGRTRLILVGGAPGTGKSTLATALARECGFRLISSDVTRRGPRRSRSGGGGSAYRTGLYAPENTEAVYGAMLEQARASLSLGYSVVIDASWSRVELRADAQRIADACAADLVPLRCHVDPDTADARITSRLQRGDDPSEATVAVARRMRADFAPWPEARTLTTSGAPEDAVGDAARILGLDLPQPSWAVGEAASSTTPPTAPTLTGPSPAARPLLSGHD